MSKVKLIPEPMDSEELREAGYKLIDWLVSYHSRVAELPVMSRVGPGDVRAALPSAPPSEGEDYDGIIADLDKVIVPGIMHWQSPNFFGYFPANVSPASIVGDLVSSGLGVQGMNWQTSPACTELEILVLDWLVGMLGLPEIFLSSGKGGGVIQDSASSASLCALLAARERASGYSSRTHGLPNSFRAYTSEQAHSSIDKAVAISGMGRRRLRKIPVDDDFAMDPKKLRVAMQEDAASGKKPIFVCATVGTTSSLAIDPIEEIAQICREFGAWLHVDAAMAGTAALCEEHRYLNAGLDQANSYCFNPHKWMITNFDCNCFYVADREPLIRALSVMPEYLRNDVSDSGLVVDYRDWQIPLGRRFRSLKLWFVIRRYGTKYLSELVREHISLAENFASWVREDPCFELCVPPHLNLVCFRKKGSDESNRRLERKLNESGDLFLTSTRLSNQHVLRFCVGQASTRINHVESAWAKIVEFAKEHD